VGQLAFHDQANGSIARLHGTDVGSSLIGQEFDGARWFHSRPSAASYDALASGGTNLGPSSRALRTSIARVRGHIAGEDGVVAGAVPPDAVTSSGSGLDPHISPAYADLQVPRVAKARGLTVADVQRLVDQHTQGRTLGFLGELRVDVLELNLSLARAGQ
jgi:K+-transporting ATPase ATPase C chain